MYLSIYVYIYKHTSTHRRIYVLYRHVIFVLVAVIPVFPEYAFHPNSTICSQSKMQGLTFTISVWFLRSVIFHLHSTLCPKVCDQHYSQSTRHDLYIYTQFSNSNKWILRFLLQFHIYQVILLIERDTSSKHLICIELGVILMNILGKKKELIVQHSRWKHPQPLHVPLILLTM